MLLTEGFAQSEAFFVQALQLVGILSIRPTSNGRKGRMQVILPAASRSSISCICSLYAL